MAEPTRMTLADCFRRCWKLALTAFVAGLLVAGVVCVVNMGDDNTCDWPNTECQPRRSAVTLLDEISGWALQAEDRMEGEQPFLRSEIEAQIQQWIGLAKYPGLRNAEGKHVCELLGPKACEEVVRIHADARAAFEAPSPGDSEPLWDKVLEGLRDFPSGQ